MKTTVIITTTILSICTRFYVILLGNLVADLVWGANSLTEIVDGKPHWRRSSFFILEICISAI